MQIRLTPYGLDAWQRGLREAPEVAKREMLAATTEATLLLERDLKEDPHPPGSHYPYATGNTMDSIAPYASIEPTGVLGVVGSASPVAVFLELGTKFMAARPSFPAAWRRNRHQIERMFEDAAGRIAGHLSGAGA